MSPDVERRLSGGIERGRALRILANGQSVAAFEGETIAAAILAAGQRALRTTSHRGHARGLYCGIGVCFECVMTVDGRPNARACQTPVRAGMRVESQYGSGIWKRDD